MLKRNVFECRMCGECCSGAGGIVVSPSDLERICVHLGLEPDEFSERYGDMRNGKLTIATGQDGKCIFFTAGQGCSVHVAKPDICRAWPFFRGNLVDPVSLSMAKDFCPGIDPGCTFDEFVRQGRQYLEENELGATDKSKEANALFKA